MTLSTQDLRDLAVQGEQCVRQAGAMIQDQWERPKAVQHKGRIDLVTETDTAVEDYLTAALHKVLPEARIVAEERAGDVAPGELAWVIDPVDGTTNFAHGLAHVAVSVGLWAEGEVVLGFVYIPRLHEFFVAWRGGGAFLNATPIHVSEVGSLEQSVVATGFPYTVAENLETILPPLGRVLAATRGIRRLGAAAVDLAYTACGRFGGFYEYGLKPWDTAAGWVLVEEAGGRVTQVDGQTLYALGSPSIMATNGYLHEALARTLGGV